MLSFVCDSILINYVQCNWVFIIFLSDCCKSVTLSATGAPAKIYPEYLGSYEATGEEHEGAPVYRNSNGDHLYKYSDGTWRADYYKIGGDGVYKSVDTDAECPASISQWQYWDYDYHSGAPTDWRSGDITVECN